MELNIQSVNFNASEKLQAFITKKTNKLERFSDDIINGEVILKIIKPETATNKEVSIKLNIKNGDVFAAKKADTFEEAVDLACEALGKQLIKTKEKNQKK